MSLTLGRVNKLYSPIMSTTLFDILLRHSYQLYKIFKYFFNNQKVSNSLLFEMFVNLFEYISIVLYCLACERLVATIGNTRSLMLKYCTRIHNYEVWLFVIKFLIIFRKKGKS